MATFQAQVQALTKITISSSGTNPIESELTQWLSDGTREIINILPPRLKIECSTITSLTSSTPMDLDASGEVFHATRENADSGYHIGCREINPIYGGSADDSSSLHYVTATDPVYWVESDTGGDPKLFVKPTPTANQPARIHHVAFPTVSYSDSAIVNFPNEAEYLVALYASIKSIQSTMSAMNASIVHSDQDGTYTASTSSSQGWEKVRDWLESEEDSEMSQATVQALSTELQQFLKEYEWYQVQQAKLQQDYDKGIQMLVAQGIPQPVQRKEAR
jgi:hypothetical protein